MRQGITHQRLGFCLVVASMATGLAGCSGSGGGGTAPSCVLDDCGSFEGYEYASFKPDTAPAAAPWLVLLHGAGTPSDYMVQQWDAVTFARDHGYVLVIPRSQSYAWNVNTDAAAVVRLVQNLQSRYGTPLAVFAVGWSSGSILSQTLACRHADVVSGVISLAGELTATEARTCAPARPIGVALIHGTLDSVVPINGGSFDLLSLDDTFAQWRTRNGCTGTNSTSAGYQLEPALSSTTTTASACLAPVQMTVTQGGKHQPAFSSPILHTFMLDFFARTLAARGE